MKYRIIVILYIATFVSEAYSHPQSKWVGIDFKYLSAITTEFDLNELFKNIRTIFRTQSGSRKPLYEAVLSGMIWVIL